MCEVVVQVGPVGDAGIEIRRVVDVPSERIASPGLESVTMDAGLSPVKGATMQSIIDHLVSYKAKH